MFTLSAIGAIREAQLGQPGITLAYLAFIVVAQSLVLALIAIAVAVPDKAQGILNRLQAWLQQNSRVITIVMSLIFGVWFILKGVNGLLA